MTDNVFIGPDQNIIGEFERNAKKAMESRVNAFKDRIQKILDEIRTLNDEKYKIQNSPLRKDELLELARAELEKKKKEHIPAVLRLHLESCQMRKDLIFNEAAIDAKIFPRDDYWRLFYYLIDEETLKSVVESLPDIGISKNLRTRRITEIDKRIEALKSEADSEFSKVATE